MSRMSTLVLSIQEDIEEGELTFDQIAEKHNVTIDWVEEAASMLDEYCDYMDGDAASALASAGWGTDEDYGYSGEDF